MAYLDSRPRPSFGSMAAVIAIHGAVGTALILGLTVAGVIAPPDMPIPTFEVKKKLPPPPPERVDEAQPKAKQPEIFVPKPPLPLPTRSPPVETTDLLPPPRPPVRQPGTGDGFSKIDPTPVPSFTAIGAKPRNDPARWVSTDDYRSNWIRQEMTGKARFRLEIAADGKVAGCTITGSSGHRELDAATCALVTKRARFQPARGNEGEPVAGSYSNAIDWRLPE